MVKFARADSLGKTPVAEGRYSGISSRDAANFQAPARALQSLGNSVGKVAGDLEATQKKIDGQDEAMASLNVLEGSMKAEHDLKSDPDYETHTSRFRKSSIDLILENSELIKDPAKRDLWKRRQAVKSQGREYRIDDNARGIEKDKNRAGLSELSSKTANMLSGDIDPADKKESASRFNQALATAVQRGDITREEAYKYQKSFHGDITKGRVATLIEGGRYDEAREYLGKSGQAKGNAQTLIAQAAQKSGISADVVLQIAKIESNFNSKAKNPKSSARGYGQFINSTGKKYGLKNDGTDSPEAQASALARFTKDNFKTLKKAKGADPSKGELYLAHFLGMGGASKLMKADPDASAATVLGSSVMKANPFLKGKTAAGVVAWAEKKMGNGYAGGATSTADGFDIDPVTHKKLMGQVDAAEKVVITATGKEITSLEKHMITGFQASEATLEALRQKVATLGDPLLKQRLAQAEAFGKEVRIFQSRPAVVNEAVIQKLREQFVKSPPSPEQVKVLEKLEDLTAKQHAMLKRDRLTWASRSGTVSVGPLDFQSDEAIDSRLQHAIDAQQIYKGEIQYFTQPDRDRLSEVAEAGGTEYLMMVGKMTERWGEEHTVKAVAELNDKAPEAAIAGWLLASGVNPGVAQEIMDGIEHRNDPNYRRAVPSKQDAEDAAQKVLSDALDRFPPQQRDAVLNVASTLYEHRNKTPGTFDRSLMTKAINDVIGQRDIGGESYGGISSPGFFGSGNSMIVPPNIKTDDFDEVFESIKLTDFANQPMHKDRKLVSETDFKRGKPAQVSATQFAINIGSDDAPQYLMDKDGTHYLIDIKQLEPILRKRNPDAYLAR